MSAETKDNPNPFSEADYEQAEAGVADAIEGPVRELWEAGGTFKDICESLCAEARAIVGRLR